MKSGSLEVPLILAGALLAAFVVRLVLAYRIATPWIMVDELIYSELAKSFADRGEFLIRETASPFRNVAYPALIAPAWLADPMATVYDIARAINVALMVVTAVPVYLWGKRLMSQGYALLAAVLVLLMPSLTLHRNADDRERLLPGVRHGVLRDRPRARAPDAASPVVRACGHRAHLRRPSAGPRARPRTCWWRSHSSWRWTCVHRRPEGLSLPPRTAHPLLADGAGRRFSSAEATSATRRCKGPASSRGWPLFRGGQGRLRPGATHRAG